MNGTWALLHRPFGRGPTCTSGYAMHFSSVYIMRLAYMHLCETHHAVHEEPVCVAGTPYHAGGPAAADAAATAAGAAAEATAADSRAASPESVKSLGSAHSISSIASAVDAKPFVPAAGVESAGRCGLRFSGALNFLVARLCLPGWLSPDRATLRRQLRVTDISSLPGAVTRATAWPRR